MTDLKFSRTQRSVHILFAVGDYALSVVFIDVAGAFIVVGVFIDIAVIFIDIAVVIFIEIAVVVFIVVVIVILDASVKYHPAVCHSEKQEKFPIYYFNSK